jgi:hypothetical protein
VRSQDLQNGIIQISPVGGLADRKKMYILGAGLAGCLAGISFDKAMILEASPNFVTNHRAILRMRNESVSHLTGIAFQKVLVRKFVYDDSFKKFASPIDIVAYSRKVSGKISSRSITDLNDDVRYIPPADFHSQLIDRLSGRITYGQKITRITPQAIFTESGMYECCDSTISTMPLDVMLNATMKYMVDGFNHSYRKIYVSELTIPDCDIHLTVYYPHLSGIYRASIIGDRLNIESVMPIEPDDLRYVQSTLGISNAKTNIHNHEQKYGKLTPIDDRTRKDVLFKLTNEFGIYSLGRFACWRNILLDDVVKDISQIKKMMNTHPYERALS